MPATLYRLASKPHYTESPETPNLAPDETPTPQVEDVVTSVVENELQIQETQSTQVEVADVVANSAQSNWDPNWTKTKLLEFALGLGLDVSSTNTKTEIINALTSAS